MSHASLFIVLWCTSGAQEVEASVMSGSSMGPAWPQRDAHDAHMFVNVHRERRVLRVAAAAADYPANNNK
jgi:hypothetical protein